VGTGDIFVATLVAGETLAGLAVGAIGAQAESKATTRRMLKRRFIECPLGGKWAAN
jgi:hypothetical protein